MPLKFSWNFVLFSFTKNRELSILIPTRQRRTLTGITSRRNPRESLNQTLKRFITYP